MARKPPIAALRKLLLAAALLIVVAVGGLFLFGRAGQKPVSPPDAEEEAEAEAGSVLIGEDFDHTFTEGEKPVFRIRGESIRADQKQTVYLQGVAVTLYDEEGRPYHVESRRASFSPARNEGRLQGNVVLKGPGGLELRTPQLQIREKGRMLVAPAVSEIRYGTLYNARSQKIWVHLPEEVFIMAGKVRVEGLPDPAAEPQPPMSLTSERLVYERKRRQVRVEGGAEFLRGRERVSARKIAVHLAQDEKSLEFLRALWDVKGQIAPEGDGNVTTVRFSGKDLSLFMQPGGNQVRKVALDGAENQKARLETVGGGVTRVMTARRVEGLLAQGVLSSAEAFGGVTVDETGRPRTADGGGGPRHAEGQRAVAQFSPEGQLSAVQLVNQVTYRDGQVRATGDRASLNLTAGKGDFLGDPVDVTSPKGRLKAPQVEYDTGAQLVHAVGGVRGVLEQVEDTALAGSPLGEGEGPVFVESQEAFWRQSPSSFLFRGEARAWRGKNVLLATELRGDKAEDKLTGTGGVKTIWIPTEEDNARVRKPGTSGTAKPGSAAERQTPIEVVASELVYRQGAGVLTYTGGVRVAQAGRTLSCKTLDVELGESKEAETMTCAGEARLNDPKEGNTITGEKAIYHLDQRRVDMFGEAGLVTMRSRDGKQVQGKRLIYHMDGGKVEILGKDEAAAAPAAPAAQPGGAG
ncbi:MAG TPA: LPS export ABC transporter periplasmic protein LptC [Thermoanaerobaculia bacterium]|nr:LPS export ABC transporter periplasmic protein LptC [Thermoanaerobaculia bacterium]